MAKGKQSISVRAGEAMRRARACMMEYAYFVTLGAVIAVVIASAMYTQHLRAQQEAGVQAAAGAPETKQTPQPTVSISPLPTIAPLEVHYAAVKPGGTTVWPLEGKVLRGCDAQTPVLWEALGSIRVHTGLDIAGDAEQEVVCAMDGVVKQIARDDLWGWRVRVEQTDGQEAVYAGLLQCGVEAGQSVTRGQALGTLLEAIPCEAEMEPHLHMELYKDGAAQNPAGILPER